jgi:putative ABC transport system ATP-binding protein
VSDGPIYTIEGITKVYRTGEVEVHALRGVDLTIDAGEFIVLLGPSGSGKSTLVNILGGLDTVTDGKVFFRDEEITAFGDGELTKYRRDHVGFVFQFYNLVPSLTARENVSLVTEIAHDPMDPGEALENRRVCGRPAQPLSRPALRRRAAARGDRPRHRQEAGSASVRRATGALDSKTGIRVLEALAQVNRELDTTVLVITHNMAVGRMADRVIHFADGSVARIEQNEKREAPASIAW